jgi:hypothetical protein
MVRALGIGIGMPFRNSVSGAALSLSGALLASEPSGLAFVSTDTAVTEYGSLEIKDASTPANNYSGAPFTFQGGPLAHARSTTAIELLTSGLYAEVAINRPKRYVDPSTLINYGYWPEESRINACLWSDDLTNAAWVKTNCTAAKTAVGADGVANSASTLTATGANATALQTITAASATRVSHAWVKRRTGTGVIEMTQDNGTTWTPVTVTAGGSRLAVPSASVTNPIVGFRIVTSGDAIDVQYVQCEAGAFMTSPIPTQGSAVTRAADTCSIATTLFNYSVTAGTMYMKMTPTGITGSRIWSLGDGGNNSNDIEYTNGTITAGANGSVAVSAIAALTSEKTAAAWAANDLAASKNGGAVATDTSVTLPTAATKLGLGRQDNVNILCMAVEEWMHLPRRMTNAELQTLTSA